MPRRYNNRTILTNQDDLYENTLEKRERNSIRHYSTPSFAYPDEIDLSEITKLPHVWSVGDRFYKLSHQHYGNPTYWWVIAYFNQAPTESELNLGDVVFIPFPLERVLRAFESED
mgnify:FL=1|jgi:hypothetical protein|tara:strand:+ start:122 stop:466 length:345 start_codon:yes stop_codon:yes gene_type:complete